MPGRLVLRDLETGDISAINDWPPYRQEYAEMDRYVRKDGLPEKFHRDSRIKTFAAVGQTGEIVGFSSLIENRKNQAEFVVFIRDDEIGKGVGERVSRMTLHQAFSVAGYQEVNLVVRRHKSKQIKLYRKLGFRMVDERLLEREGQWVPFFEMVLHRTEYEEVNRNRT